MKLIIFCKNIIKITTPFNFNKNLTGAVVFFKDRAGEFAKLIYNLRSMT